MRPSSPRVSPPTTDVVVVGAGVMGCATAYALARRGQEVILLEQFHRGHAHGSSHGRSRIFRLSYAEPRFVRLAQEAGPSWRELEAEAGERLLTTTGGLDVGHQIDVNARALDECGASYELISGREAGGRWPLLAFPATEPVLFQHDAGFIAADRAVAALAEGAVAAGAEVREDTRVRAIEDSGGRAEVTTDAGSLIAGTVVVTAGPWAPGLLEGIALPVRPTRETVSYFALESGAPLNLVEWGDPTLYALPDPGRGIKVGEHVAGPTAHPDEPGAPNPDSVARATDWVARRFPTVAPSPLGSETCFYTNTSDERFILERHGNVVIGSACSGHGFKFALLIGRRLADLATRA